jgi:hypothetical protein
MELINNQVLKLKLRSESADIILNDIERSEVLSKKDGVTEIAIYWGLEEMTRLNQILRFSKNLPSPITKEYNWPGLYKPFSIKKQPLNFYL